MSDYTLQATWSTKDALATGSALKVVSATELGTEFDAISTAIATKYDSTDIASQALAEAETSNAVLITPLRLASWSDFNAGIVGDLQSITAPAEDVVLGYDFSATTAVGFTLGAGIALTGTVLAADFATIDHDSLLNYVGNEHIDHSGVSITAGNGLTGGGTIAATRTLNVVGGAGITANAGDIALTDAAASTTNPVDISTGAVSIDLTALTTIEGNALAAGDLIYVDDGGVSKAIKIEEAGLQVQAAQATQTLAAVDLNTIMEFTATATLTLPAGLPIGVPVVLNMKHATQALTVLADTGVTLVTVNHPAGATAVSDTLTAGGSAIAYQTAASVWALSGDITD